MSMNVFENPFYILGASTRDNRRRISALAEERAFLSNPETVNEARSALLIPQKRLEAELRWFPGVDDEKLESILNFLRSFREGSASGRVNLSDVKSIALLNVAVYMFRFRRFRDNAEIAESISAINGCFDGLAAETVYDAINKDREAAGFPVAEEMDIESEFQNYRADIVKVISEKLTKLSQAEYVNLAKQLSDNYNGTETICGDLLDDYALRVSSKMEEQKQAILDIAAEIQSHLNSASEHEFDNLFSHIRQWGQMSSPSISVAKKRGLGHVSSLDDAEEIEMLYKVRQLALELHNKGKRTEKALKIIQNLRDNLFNLPLEALKLLDEDIKTLESIIKVENERKKEREDDEKWSAFLSKEKAVRKREGRRDTLLFIPVLLFVAVVFWAFTSQSTFKGGKSKNTSQTVSSYSQGMSKNSWQTRQQRRVELDSQLRSLKWQIDSTRREIDDIETQLETMASNIRSYKSNYEAWHKETDRLHHNSEVNDYNALLRQYNSLVEKGKNDVARYNRMVDEYNSLRRLSGTF